MKHDETIAAEVSDLLKDVAERIVIPRFGTLTADEIQEKRPGDLVTIADRQAEDAIARALSRLTPHALIVGEEAAFANPAILDGLAQADQAWCIDPIDGTRNFTRHCPDFAIMVARMESGVVTQAWIYQPMHATMYQGEKGAGVRRNGQPIARHTDRTRLCGSAYRKIDPVPDQVDLKRSWRSCGIDYPKLLEGEIDFVLYRDGKPWDHLPGSLMVAEMGGRCAMLTGETYRPGSMKGPLSVIPQNRWEEVREALMGPLPPVPQW
ncbi:MAG: inositol monophosphatase [Propionibacteriaceae bacterium]|nr:inositol monophosphatase [Propionibacteriaceae bacterium]